MISGWALGLKVSTTMAWSLSEGKVAIGKLFPKTLDNGLLVSTWAKPNLADNGHVSCQGLGGFVNPSPIASLEHAQSRAKESGFSATSLDHVLNICDNIETNRC